MWLFYLLASRTGMSLAEIKSFLRERTGEESIKVINTLPADNLKELFRELLRRVNPAELPEVIERLEERLAEEGGMVR